MGVTPPALGQGFRRRIYTLRWPADSMWGGLVVKCKPASIGTVAELLGIKDLSIEDASDLAPEELEALKEVFRKFGSLVVSWNLTDDEDQPVPVDVESLVDEDFLMAMAIIGGYMQAISSVPPPLADASSSGQPLEEASIPMEPLSESPPNSSEPN